jgi:hypothetical protein
MRSLVPRFARSDTDPRERRPAAERPAQLRPGPGPQSERQSAEHRGERRHEDGPETQPARLLDRLRGGKTVVAPRLDGEVDHRERVLTSRCRNT